MDVTIHDIPIELHQALALRAAADQSSVAKALVEAAAQQLGIALPPSPEQSESSGAPKKYRDLSDIAGTWIEDPEFDAILAEQRQIDPELWQ
jgi:hypothetical protein